MEFADLDRLLKTLPERVAASVEQRLNERFKSIEQRLPSQLVSEKHAAEILGWSKSKVIRWRKAGLIPHIKKEKRGVLIDLTNFRGHDAEEIGNLADRSGGKSP